MSSKPETGGRSDPHQLVQDAYGALARQRGEQAGESSCCGPKGCCGGGAYEVADHPVPEAELGVSCGTPVAFSHIREGDVVLDLGSGAGKDVFLAARATGPHGRAIGVDMTPEMLDLAGRNAAKFRQRTGLDNVEFRHGRIEQLPVEDATIDVVISNCVINLSPDKPRVFREVHRALRPGGRMVVSDLVLERPLPEAARVDAALYAACIGGALLRGEYLQAIREAGFEWIEILDEHAYAVSSCCGESAGRTDAAELRGAVSSITVLAVKAAGRGCCCRE